MQVFTLVRIALGLNLCEGTILLFGMKHRLDFYTQSAMEAQKAPATPEWCVSMYATFQELNESLSRRDIVCPIEVTNFDMILRSLFAEIGEVCRKSVIGRKNKAQKMMDVFKDLSELGNTEAESFRLVARAFSLPLRICWFMSSESSGLVDRIERFLLNILHSPDIREYFAPPGVEKVEILSLFALAVGNLVKRPKETVLMYEATLSTVMNAFANNPESYSFPIFDLIQLLNERLVRSSTTRSVEKLMRKIIDIASSDWKVPHVSLLNIMREGESLIRNSAKRMSVLRHQILYSPHLIFVVIESADLNGTPLAEALVEVIAAIVDAVSRFPSEDSVHRLHNLVWRRLTDLLTFLKDQESGFIQPYQQAVMVGDITGIIHDVLQMFPFRS